MLDKSGDKKLVGVRGFEPPTTGTPLLCLFAHILLIFKEKTLVLYSNKMHYMLFPALIKQQLTRYFVLVISVKYQLL